MTKKDHQLKKFTFFVWFLEISDQVLVSKMSFPILIQLYWKQPVPWYWNYYPSPSLQDGTKLIPRWRITTIVVKTTCTLVLEFLSIPFPPRWNKTNTMVTRNYKQQPVPWYWNCYPSPSLQDGTKLIPRWRVTTVVCVTTCTFGNKHTYHWFHIIYDTTVLNKIWHEKKRGHEKVCKVISPPLAINATTVPKKNIIHISVAEKVSKVITLTKLSTLTVVLKNKFGT